MRDDVDYVTDDDIEDDTNSDESIDGPQPGLKDYYSSLHKNTLTCPSWNTSTSKLFNAITETYCGLKIEVPDNEDPMGVLVRQTATLFE